MHRNRRRSVGAAKLAALGSLLAVGLIALLLAAPWESRGVNSEQKLKLFCAAGMSKPVQAIVHDYKEEYGVQVQVELGGSGMLLSQIRGAPNLGDLYLAADPSYITEAREAGLVAESIPVARIRPVIIVNGKTQQAWQEEGKAIASLDDLLREDVHLVLANPELASVGQITKKILTQTGHWEKIEERLRQHGGAKASTVGTVMEVNTTVSLRSGYVGIVWDAVAMLRPDLAVVHVPQFDLAVEHVTIGVLTAAKDSQATAALQFARYLTARDKGLVRFEEYDFEPVPDADQWDEHPTINLSSGSMLKPGIDEAVKAFELREGVTINTNYNGCGILVSQMKGFRKRGQGDKFPDAYFSCDVQFLQMVQQWFEAGVTISKNDMVMIVQKGNPKKIRSVNDLKRKDLKIGLAHQENSALGRLFDDLLRDLGLHKDIYADDWRERIVHVDAGHDLVNKMRVKALDVAVVYRSNAQSNPVNLAEHMDFVEIDVVDALAEQPFAIAKDSDHKYLMKRLLRAIVSEETAERFREKGFRWEYRSGE